MALRGETKDVAITPLAVADADPEETFVPAQIALTNGRLTDLVHWKKRPGFAEKWDLGESSRIAALIPLFGGYALTQQGTLWRLGSGSPVQVTEANSGGQTGLPPATRPRWVDFDNTLVIVAGGQVMSENPLTGTDQSLTIQTAYEFKWIAALGTRLLGAGHDKRQWRWTDAGTTTWTSGNNSEVASHGGDVTELRVMREDIYIFKQEQIEVWGLGSSEVTFVRNYTIEKGTRASDSVVYADDHLFFFGSDGDFYELVGASPKIISDTYRSRLDEIANRDECYGFDFPKENVIRWYFPTDGRVFVYDYRNKTMSEDDYYEGSQLMPFPVNAAMWLDGEQYVGDRRLTGVVHRWSHDYETDDGEEIRVARRILLPLSASGRRAHVTRALWRMKRGEANLATEPVLIVRYRFDQGAWTGYEQVSLGQGGATNPYAERWSLGIGRELEMDMAETDPVSHLLTNLFLTVRELGQ